MTAAEGQAARVDNLRFAAFCFPDGDAWVLLLEVTSLGGEGVLVAREPDEFSGHYISNTVQGAPWGFLKARVRTRDASGQRRPAQLDYSPVNFVYLEAGDCFRRRCRLAVSNVSGIRDLRMTYFVHDGPSFRHKPFAGEVLLPEVPLLERPAGGGDVRDGTVGR
ncbi:MAG TPA: hypothetical protein PLP01_03375 [Phycisphaerae bacterium]|nr:hypothetical protein [Phycisphaerae bacterium]